MKEKLLLLFVFIVTITAYSHATEGQILLPQISFVNPIIPGGFPAPSICKVDDTFYIVNSSFEYFPGLPNHKSKDLINWELIGYGLHREEQCTNEVNLVDVQSKGGIHAPTIRYSNGRFYIITTNVYYNEADQTTHFVNFIITAENPEGPWSDLHVLKGAPGIDPDIFFDDDGRVWYIGTHSPENPTFEGEGGDFVAGNRYG
ncbi:family 43 glycosylhydrolase [Marinilabilia rubra]|uniref:family 43 glycosylhydrolase n=1 Tax=Marinilabilia rubra TaxID=2162893 RepID=UPI0018E07B29|nr:family 43 glycosylhydrolase [Marinilabilia rubra]